MKWRNVIVVVLLVLPIVGILALGFGRDPHAVPFALRGKPAPEFELRTLDGKAVKLSELRGKPVVLNFWSTWCEPCKAEHELLQSAAQFYGDSVRFLGVVYQDQEPVVRAYLQGRSNLYPQLFDPTTSVAIDFGVAGVPESFLVDAQGVVREKQAGVVNGKVLRDWLDPLVEKRP